MSAAVAVTALMVGVAGPAAADPLTINDLGTLPGDTDSQVYGLNNAGTVVGESTVGPSYNPTAQHAVSWNAAGVISALPLPAGDTDPGSSATAINDAGTIVGVSIANNVYHALRWNTDGTITALNALPGDDWARPDAISADGTAIGQSVSPAGVEHAVRWNPDGTVTDLPNLYNDSNTFTDAINSSDAIIGYSYGQSEHALRWNPDGTITDLSGVLAGQPTISDSGVIIGVNAANHGIRLNPDGSTVDLGFASKPTAIGADGTMVGGGGDMMHTDPIEWAPNGTVTGLRLPQGSISSPPDYDGWAHAINPAGTIVGYTAYFVTQYQEQAHAASWTESGAVTPLGFLPGGNTSDAQFINDSGTIAGTSNTAGGQQHAVVWR